MQKGKKFFETIASKVIPSCIHNVSQIIKSKKIVAGVAAGAVALFAGSTLADDSKLSGIETVYHVYVEGDRIGSVDSTEIVDQLVDRKIKDVQEGYKQEEVNLVIGEELELIPENVFNKRVENNETIAQLNDSLSVKAEATALTIGDKLVGYVKNEEKATEVINQLKQKYVSKEVLDSLKNKEKNSELKQALPNVGESIITNVELSEEIAFDKGVVELEDMLTVDEAIIQLTRGTLEDKIHTVLAGDVLGSIAEQYNLKISEVLAINPGLTEGTLLRIGDEVNVTDYEPYVYVIVEETKTMNKEIPFQTETKDDKTMWKGDTKVQQEGQPGERVVSYALTKKNGATVEQHQIEEKIIKEPVNKVVLRGTKVSTSRGTGTFSWPAVGGYISSYQGQRWGRLHKGIDIARPSERSILAADNGTVASAGRDGGYGNKVVINHNNGYKTIYAHLSSIDVNVGQTVAAGQKIGVMGSTGNSTGVHLHFEIYKNGSLKNPMDYLKK